MDIGEKKKIGSKSSSPAHVNTCAHSQPLGERKKKGRKEGRGEGRVKIGCGGEGGEEGRAGKEKLGEGSDHAYGLYPNVRLHGLVDGCPGRRQ